jgi:hypothetical protein
MFGQQCHVFSEALLRLSVKCAEFRFVQRKIGAIIGDGKQGGQPKNTRSVAKEFTLVLNMEPRSAKEPIQL